MDEEEIVRRLTTEGVSSWKHVKHVFLMPRQLTENKTVVENAI